MNEIHYLISDASKKVDVESHVLRYWEDELELKIPRNEMGHRYYTEFHIRLFQQIKELKEKGYQLKAIKSALEKMLEEGGDELSDEMLVQGAAALRESAVCRDGQSLQVVEEGTINVLAKDVPLPWFVAGDPATGRSIQVDYLNGMKTPSIRRSQPAGRLGYVWDLWMDWGVSVVDWRGIAKNPGAKQ